MAEVRGHEITIGDPHFVPILLSYSFRGRSSMDLN